MIALPKVSDIREYFRTQLAAQNFVTDKSGAQMLELIGASFIADEPAVFGEVNADYVERELAWYISQSLNVNDIPGGPPKIWSKVATPSGEINSNYGWCIFSEENHLQYKSCLKQLIDFTSSRRAVMLYTRPSMQVDYSKDGMSDFMCTNAVQYLIRDNALHAVVQMRSNDLIFGYKNDYAWQAWVLQNLLFGLNVQLPAPIAMGTITWQVGSLHVYSRHFNLITS